MFIVGLFFFLLGLLLIGIYGGAFPYSEASTAGFILVLASLQTITMGRTPFGDVRRSWFVVTIGIVLGVLGTLSIFFPSGAHSVLARWLAALTLAIGGITLLVRLVTSEEGAKTWLRVGGILRQLAVVLGVVYVLEALVGIGSFIPFVATNKLWALVVLALGASLLYASWCVQKVNRLYRPEETKLLRGE
jgi:hypothetical protein